MVGQRKFQRGGLLGMIDLIKSQSKKFSEIIQPDMEQYMVDENVFVLTKLSNIFKDDKVYLLEVDTSVSIENPSLLDYELLQKYLDENHYEKMIFWGVVLDQKICSYLPDNLTTPTQVKSVGDFIYIDFDKNNKVFNFQQSFNREFSFVEHLSSSKWWTRDHFQNKLLMPQPVKSTEDITENRDGVPDFIIKDVEVDSGKGIYLFDKEDFQKEFDTLYCEQYIDSDFHFNTYHLCGKGDTIDITNYDNMKPLDYNMWDRVDKKTDIPNPFEMELKSNYKSYHADSPEYLSG